MIVSQARILSSQTNGARSNGPTSPEGKQISRANSLKHGLTGAGIVLPSEDVEEVSRRFDELQAQFNPATPMGKILVNRIALHSVRLEHSAVQEAAFLGEKIRHAKDDFDQQRQIDIRALLNGLDDHPALSVSRLLRMPDGIDALIREWDGLRDNLGGSNARYWTAAHSERANLLTGRQMDEIAVSRINALSNALWGDFGLLEAHEGAGLKEDARRTWAKDRLIELIDEELTALRDCREGLDLEAFEQDREEAPKRALFDSSKPAVLARRYEAANERGLFRALKELQKVEKEAAENPQPSASCPIGPLGSFFPASEAPIGWESEPEMASDDGLPTISRSNRVEIGEKSFDSEGRQGMVPRFRR
jgi:hypothetical protein